MWVPVTTAWRIVWFAGRGKEIQLFVVAVDILNKLQRTAENGWYSEFGLDERWTPNRKREA